jgi:outer membrane immunogenic protein
MKLLTALSAACGLAFMATSAAAADIDLVEEPVAPNWTGFYIGVDVGYRWGDFDMHLEPDLANILEDDELEDVNLEDEGFIGSIHVGFDWDTGAGIVLGVLADVQAGEKLNDSVINDVPSYGGEQEFSAELNAIGTVAARAGFAVSNALIYGLAGISWTDLEQSYFEGCTPSCDNIDASDSEIVHGFTFGIGGEMMVSENISIGAEARHTDFDEFEMTATSETETYGSITSVDAEVTSMVLKLNWRF